jgi:transitional endoplasmic reticulum ATPase
LSDAADQQPPKESMSPPSQVNEVAKDHWKKGNTLFETSKFPEAIVEYNEALKIDPNYADAYFNRALTERIMHDYDGAKKDLEVVLKLQPKSFDAPLLIGDIAESKNDLLGARFWYEKSLANNPNYLEAKNRLEHIDSLIHMEPTSKPPATVSSGGTMQKSSTYKEGETVIEEGQIKKLSFYKSKVKFDSVIGLEDVKKYMYENVVLAIQKPELFQKYGKKQGVGLILYGPPGVGKTHIVDAIAGEANANVIIARINQIIDMYTGNTEKNLHAVFEQARQNTPCIVMFDELDALGTKRSGGDGPGGGGESSAMRLAVNQFLVEMNGLESNPEGIFVIGTTNQPWDIDPALKRSGRFGDHIYLSPPNHKHRVEMFKYATRNMPKGHLDFERLARATAGYSPADIERRIVDKAAMRPLLHEYQFQKSRNLTTEDMLAIIADKDTGGSSLDEWYLMVKKDVISKTETQIVDGKKQEIVKEGKLDAEEKLLYKKMIKDIKANTGEFPILMKRFARWWALHIF